MFLIDPQPSQGDLHFRAFGFPVRVHPYFWIMTVLLGLADSKPLHVMIWVVVVFLSILIHEVGHAVAIRYYGGWPRIVLYSFGGLAIDEATARRRAGQQIVISFAGPAAGFVLAALVVLLVMVSGHESVWLLRGQAVNWGAVVAERMIGQSYFLVEYWFEPFQSHVLNVFVLDMLFVNIFWGLINLLPVYPLDGGQISRELFLVNNPWQGMTRSLWVSTITAAAVAFYALAGLGSIYMAIFFGYLAYASWITNQGYTGRGRGPVW